MTSHCNGSACVHFFIGLVYGKNYRKPPYFMVKAMVSGVDFPFQSNDFYKTSAFVTRLRIGFIELP